MVLKSVVKRLGKSSHTSFSYCNSSAHDLRVPGIDRCPFDLEGEGNLNFLETFCNISICLHSIQSVITNN
jgi:hypothetical protein